MTNRENWTETAVHCKWSTLVATAGLTILDRLVGYEIITTNSALRACLAIKHFFTWKILDGDLFRETEKQGNSEMVNVFHKKVAMFLHAFVSSRLDYCSSLLYGLPKESQKKLPHVQNIAAKQNCYVWA